MANVKTRNYRFMLYPDDKSHMLVFKRLCRDPVLKPYWCGIWHTSGKKHCHIVLQLVNGRSWSSLCEDLGCSSRWCRPIGYKESDKGLMVKVKWDNLTYALAYLTHSNSPDKEQYTDDKVFGAPSMIVKASSAACEARSKLYNQADCLKAVRTWIVAHYGRIITPMAFVGWITDTPYMKAINSVWVRNMIDSHNMAVYAKENARLDPEDLEQARSLYERRQLEQLTAESDLYRVALDSGVIKIDDFQPLY